MKCAVGNCKQSNSKKTSVSFYNFPKDAAQSKRWVKFCNRWKPIDVKKDKICGLHFKHDDFERNIQFEMGFSNRRAPKLKPGAVPTIETRAIANEIKIPDEIKIEIPNEVEILNEVEISNEAEIPNEVEFLIKVEIPNEIEISNEFEIPNEFEITNEIENPNEIIIPNEFEILTCDEKNTPMMTNPREGDLQLYIKTLKMEINTLRIKNKMLKKLHSQSAIKIKKLSRKVHSLNFASVNLEKALSRMFTKGQIKKLKNNGKRIIFTEEDIAQSITLYSTSAKAYELLRKKHFPLPAARTVQRWSKKLDMSTGILEPVVKIMSAANHMSETEKLCVLSFDEMKATQKHCYDKSIDSTLSPTNNILVAFLRGLTTNWKQPIYYDYDCLMSKTILFKILKTMKQCGFTIVAIVCNLGDGNRKLFNELEVDFNKTWFLYDDTKIFVFNDVPHLMKLLRNHFINNGFIINNKEVKKDIIMNLLSLQSNDSQITHKISAPNLSMNGTDRQNVKLAIKLFSHTIAQSIMEAASLGYFNNQNWRECYELFQLTNDWFDVMNSSKLRQDTRKQFHAYGLALEIQNDILDNMAKMMSDFRVIGNCTLLPFQKGIIQSNNALKMLHIELKNRYNIDYILTYRLNLEVVENFFAPIRSKGGLNDQPDRQEFKSRLRSYILGYTEGILGNKANAKVNNTPDLDVSNSLTGSILQGNTPSLQEVILKTDVSNSLTGSILQGNTISLQEVILKTESDEEEFQSL